MGTPIRRSTRSAERLKAHGGHKKKRDPNCEMKIMKDRMGENTNKD
jgi:hypothetical protein